MPEPLDQEKLTNRDTIIRLAQKVFCHHPNLVAQIETHMGPVVIKWFGWRSPIRFYLSPALPSRAWTSWEVAQALNKVAARTPRPIYVYTRRRHGFIIENYLISASINPHQTLRVFLKSDASRLMMEKAVKDLALSIARMHKAGIQHRDFTTANFLVNEQGEVYIVDLNRARLRRRLSNRRRLADLARLNFNARNPELGAHLSHLFFKVYRAETGVTIDWEKGYRIFRHRWQRLKGWKKRLRRPFRRK